MRRCSCALGKPKTHSTPDTAGPRMPRPCVSIRYVILPLTVWLLLVHILQGAAAQSKPRNALKLPDGFNIPSIFTTPHWLLPKFVPGQFIVHFKKRTLNVSSTIDSILTPLAPLDLLEEVTRFDGNFKGFTLRLLNNATNIVAGLLSLLAALPQVDNIEPDWLFYPSVASVQAGGGRWEVGMGTLRIQAARLDPSDPNRAIVQPTTNSSGVVVAVMDTGVDAKHPDLQGGIIQGGVSFVGENALDDQNGHGTHVAGIISAANNGRGVMGVMPGTRLQIVQVFNAKGIGTASSIIAGINWVASNAKSKRIRVVNMSLGGTPSVGVCRALTLAMRQGLTFVAAAGNHAKPVETETPANCPGVLVVTSMNDYDGKPGGLYTPSFEKDKDDSFSDFSNYGNSTHTRTMVAAPGRLILSSWAQKGCNNNGFVCVSWGPYGFMSGTSMAAPHVSALLAQCYRRGVCKAQSGSELAALVDLSLTYNANRTSYGFKGGPHQAVQGKYYGPLVFGNQW